MIKVKGISYFTGALLAFIGLGGIICGFMFILEPNGSSLGLSENLLKNSPFQTYLIPGVILLVIHGIFSLAGALMAFMVHRHAGILTMILGVAMVIWIALEVYWLGVDSFLQPLMFAVGIIEIILGVMQNSRHPKNTGMFKHYHRSHPY